MPFSVMAGLVPAIHVVRLACGPKGFAGQEPTMCERTVSWDDVDGRDKPGHDGEGRESLLPFRTEPEAAMDGI
jgi:hypothetical protein